MTCKNIKEKIPDYLIGELDAKARGDIKAHISSCSSCREELENLNGIWTKLGVLPEEQPDSNLRDRFYTMLESYKEGLNQERNKQSRGKIFERWIEKWFPKKPAFQFVFTVTFVVLGFFIGAIVSSSGTVSGEITELRTEVQNMRQAMAISMLKHQSPSDRLSGVTWTSLVKKPSNNTLQTLLQTLNNDSNVNVRLAVIDALYLFADLPIVRQGIIRSIPRQDCPIVQTALIDLIVDIREKRAVKALKQLLNKQVLEPGVKQHAESSIQKLVDDSKKL